MNVGFGRRHDSQPLSACDGDVAVHIALRVDDHCLSRALAADQVGVLRQLGVDDLPEEHVCFLTDWGRPLSPIQNAQS